MVSVETILRWILYLTIFTGFFGSTLEVYRFNNFSIFAFRIFLILLIYIFVIFLFQSGKLNLKNINVKNYMLFFVFWLLYASISISWAVSVNDAIREIFFLFSGVALIILMVMLLNDKKSIYSVYYIWLLVVLISLIVAIWEISTGDHLFSSKLYGETRQHVMYNPTSLFYNQNDFATFLTLSFPLVLMSFVFFKKKVLKIIGLLMALILIYVLIETGSRANLLALVLQFFVYIFLFTSLSMKLKLVIVSPFIVSLLIYLEPAFIYIPVEIVEQIKSVYEDAFLDGGSIVIRLNLIKSGIYHAISSWGIGVGAANIETYIANYDLFYTGNVTNVHNWWVELLSNYGVIILLGYIILYFNILKKLYIYYVQNFDVKMKLLCKAIFIGLIGFIIGSTSPSSLMTHTYKWVYFGLSITLLNYLATKEKSDVSINSWTHHG
ncbi:O-antigen ligase family protein [Natranaerobius trueperi]|uniref:O-antigen ligase-related domain-containing protein n=1 Tax=Natranaerobius trueperi TaxID=759412 RepID=A0A226BY19_9FIRM|nr:O-antigen ligase family protein [Natranaerobius trueperi]OWZ83234.1 hypothetical protein CDO51_09650 [Natranaerobius trueperi]